MSVKSISLAPNTVKFPKFKVIGTRDCILKYQEFVL